MILMTVAGCAGEARVSKMTIYRLIQNADLPYVRVGRSYRIVRENWLIYLSKELK